MGLISQFPVKISTPETDVPRPARVESDLDLTRAHLRNNRLARQQIDSLGLPPVERMGTLTHRDIESKPPVA